MTSAGPLRIGALGAARITPMALLRPAREVAEAKIVAVAARDAERARRFAAKHGVPTVHESYEALLGDPDIEAVYNPLPNGLHCEWSIRALEAGKHVLCEKPLASNGDEAQAMADAATRTGRVLVEAFHYRYHPLAERMQEILESGVLGKIRHLETHLCIPLPFPNDIRYQYALAGGATMDVGCYAISLLRFLAGAEPEVTYAQAKMISPHVDRYMEAGFRFADGRTGRITCSLLSARLVRAGARVCGDDGELRVLNPYAPQLYHRLRLRTRQGTTTEKVAGDATYTHQLRAFVACVRNGSPSPTGPENGAANMRVIDAVYAKAGLPRRGTQFQSQENGL